MLRPVDEWFAFSSPKAWSTSRGGPTDLAIETLGGNEADVGGLRTDPRNVAVMDADVALVLITLKSQAPANVTTLKQVGAVKMPDGLVAWERTRRHLLDKA